MTRNPDALIRIEDAIKVLCREKCYPGLLCPDNRCDDMWDKFEDVERVDTVPVVHGQWIHYLGDGLRWKCSNCGSRYETPWHYCPNCLAKMDGGDYEST